MPLSADGARELPERLSGLLSASNGATTRAEGAAVLREFLERFRGKDHEALKAHFEHAVADTGMHFLDSWKYRDKAAKDVGQAKNAAVAKAKVNRKRR